MQLNNRAQTFIQSEEIEWEKVGEGIDRKILGYDDVLMMVSVRFSKGSVGTLHHHVHRQISYVESGVFKVTINDQQKVLQKGDCFFVQPDLVHGVVALEQGTLIDIFSPCRKDFLS